jgi:transglutaminase-like putative cysteine protease
MTEAEAAFLAASEFIDADHPAIAAFVREAAPVAPARERAIALYYAVRDGIRYDVYLDYASPETFRASSVLAAGRGFCVGKAALLAAGCRAAGIPARVGYADVRNHVTSPRVRALMQGDYFSWHSYTEIKIDGRWVKATPAFDRALCERAGMAPLEFDGATDSIFHPFDAEGRRRMEYLAWRGTFADVPFATILADFRMRYPALIAAHGERGDFRAEASAPSD